MTPENFRIAFRQLAAGVSVVTFWRDGCLHGFTATSVTSVSLSPPLALFCVGRQNRSYAHLRVGTPIGISILSADQQHLSDRFAAKAGSQGYDDIETLEYAARAPLIAGAISHLEGTVAMLIPAGDHVVVLCDLAEARTHTCSQPLLYWRRGYHAIAPLSVGQDSPECAGAKA